MAKKEKKDENLKRKENDCDDCKELIHKLTTMRGVWRAASTVAKHRFLHLN